jgi:hypothetical protein
MTAAGANPSWSRTNRAMIGSDRRGGQKKRNEYSSQKHYIPPSVIFLKAAEL